MLTPSRLSCPFHRCCRSVLVISSPLPIVETARGEHEAAAVSSSLFCLYLFSQWTMGYLSGFVFFPVAGRVQRRREESLSLMLAATSCRVFGNVEFGRQCEAVVPMKTGMAGNISPVVTAMICAAQTECSPLLNRQSRTFLLPGKALCLTLPKAKLGQFFGRMITRLF